MNKKDICLIITVYLQCYIFVHVALASPNHMPETPQYLELLKKGNAENQYNQGKLLLEIDEIINNHELAFKLFEKAAEQGYAPAQYELSIYYNNGIIVNKNFEKAFELCKSSAEQGNKKGMFGLAQHYLYGIGVEQDDLLAYFWFTRSADIGDVHTRYLFEQIKNNLEQKGIDIINLQNEIMKRNKVEMTIIKEPQTTVINNTENKTPKNEIFQSSPKWLYVVASILIFFVAYLFIPKKHKKEKS